MKSIPLFVPTSAGPMSALAVVPDADRVRGPAVALLPGLEAERVRMDAINDIARGLAANGQPSISFDYPGIGMSPSRGLERAEVPRILGEACTWFREETGLNELALAGICGGGHLSLSIAANDQSIRAIVAQGIPLRLRERKVRSKARAGLAALDWAGPRVVSSLSRGTNVKYSKTEWNTDLIEKISAVAIQTRVVLAFGGEDRAYQDFQELLETELISRDAAESLSLSVLPGEYHNLLGNESHQDWFTEIVIAALRAPAEAGSR